MAEPVTLALIDEIRADLERLHAQPELDARDRHSIFIIRDMLSNLSPARDRQARALDDLISQTHDMEPSNG